MCIIVEGIPRSQDLGVTRGDLCSGDCGSAQLASSSAASAAMNAQTTAPGSPEAAAAMNSASAAKSSAGTTSLFLKRIYQQKRLYIDNTVFITILLALITCQLTSMNRQSYPAVAKLPFASSHCLSRQYARQSSEIHTQTSLNVCLQIIANQLHPAHRQRRVPLSLAEFWNGVCGGAV